MNNIKIALIGFMGSGKTSVARLLSAQSGLKHIELDELIQQHFNRSISEIFSFEGENSFRIAESKLLNIASKQEGIILDLGGGALLSLDNQNLLIDRDFWVIYLKASLTTCEQRITELSTRPLFQNSELRQNLYTQRLAAYEKLASYTIETDQLTISQIVEEIFASYFRNAYAG